MSGDGRRLSRDGHRGVKGIRNGSWGWRTGALRCRSWNRNLNMVACLDLERGDGRSVGAHGGESKDYLLKLGKLRFLKVQGLEVQNVMCLLKKQLSFGTCRVLGGFILCGGWQRASCVRVIPFRLVWWVHVRNSRHRRHVLLSDCAITRHPGVGIYEHPWVWDGFQSVNQEIQCTIT